MDYSKYIKRPGYELPPGYNPSKYSYSSATADMVILCFAEKKLQVLLVRRKKNPFQGYWALPGGFVEPEEDLSEAAARELLEETGLRKIKLVEFGAFGHPHRDPRARTITIAWLALVRKGKVKPRAGDDAAEVGWFPAFKTPELAFDHELVLKGGLARLRELAVLTPALFDLLPEKFTGEDSARLCGQIFKRNFKAAELMRHFKAGGLIRPAGGNFFRFAVRKFDPSALSYLIAKSR